MGSFKDNFTTAVVQWFGVYGSESQGMRRQAAVVHSNIFFYRST